MSLKNKVAIVTGGTGALGRAVTTALLEAGCTVHVSYIVEAELAQLPSDLPHREALHCQRLDLTDEDAVTRWFASLPRLDILVNVAGGFSMSSIVETSLESWNHMFDLNLKTAFLCCREGLKRMAEHENGRIVNVGAFAATRRSAGMGPYTASKAALLHLTEVLAEETLASKTTVNAVLPTIMDTPGNRSAMPDADFDTWVPVGHVASTICFLAQAENWHITGALIPVRAHC